MKRLVDAYCDASKASVSAPLVLGFAGTEIIRRILGVAQLPIEADLKQRKRWLDLGANFVVACSPSLKAPVDVTEAAFVEFM